MTLAEKRKTSVSLSSSTLDEARALGLNVSAVAEEALARAVKLERNRRWVEENREAFAAQSKWHEEHGHKLAALMYGPAAETWKR